MSSVEWDNEAEKSGLVLKKSSKGPFWQTRFFRTKTSHLQYWKDKAAFVKDPHSPPSDFEICDFKIIDYKVGRLVNLLFSDSKFGLHLQFQSEQEAKEWYEILLAKRSMYSVHQLLVDMKEGRNRCVTHNFAEMLVLSEVEQSKWLLERIQEQFTVASKLINVNIPQATASHSTDELIIVSAARRCVEEFIKTCNDCSTELRHRNPKIMAHCKRYMNMYEKLITGRLILHLSCIVPSNSFKPTQKRNLSELGVRVICSCIGLMERLEVLKIFVFLNQDLYKAVTETLFTIGELMSALLDLSIERIEAWFASLMALSLTQRCGRLLEIKSVLCDILTESYLEIIAPDIDSTLQKSLYQRIITTALLTFNDQLALVSSSFDQYTEEGQIAHINACQEVQKSFSSGALSWAVPIARPLSTNTLPSNPFFSSTGESSEKVNRKPSPSVFDGTTEMYEMAIPTAVLDSLRDTCWQSARSAACELVRQSGKTSSPMLDCLIDPKTCSGQACELFVMHFDSWCAHAVELIPPVFGAIVQHETGRMLALLYIQTIIKRYAENKRIKLTVEGVSQIGQDLKKLQDWINQNILNAESTCEELGLIFLLGDFLSLPELGLLEAFAAGVLKFGLHFGYHLYDLLRLMLKIRLDFTTKLRKNVLGLTAEFLSVLNKTLVSDPDLLCGISLSRYVRQVRILDELCPKVFIEHCTGKKWSLESLPDPTVARIMISQVVSGICIPARKFREERQKEAIAIKRNNQELLNESDAKPSALSVGETPIHVAIPSSFSPSPETEQVPLTLSSCPSRSSISSSEQTNDVDRILNNPDFEESSFVPNEDLFDVDRQTPVDTSVEVPPASSAQAPPIPGQRDEQEYEQGGEEYKSAEMSFEEVDRIFSELEALKIGEFASEAAQVIEQKHESSESLSKPPSKRVIGGWSAPPKPPLKPSSSYSATPHVASIPPVEAVQYKPPSSSKPTVLQPQNPFGNASPECNQSKPFNPFDEQEGNETLKMPVAVLVGGSNILKAPPPKPPRRASAPGFSSIGTPNNRTEVLITPSAATSQSTIVSRSITANAVSPPPFPPTISQPIRGIKGSASADEANRQAALRRQKSSIQDRLKNA